MSSESAHAEVGTHMLSFDRASIQSQIHMQVTQQGCTGDVLCISYYSRH